MSDIQLIINYPNGKTGSSQITWQSRSIGFQNVNNNEFDNNILLFPPRYDFSYPKKVLKVSEPQVHGHFRTLSANQITGRGSSPDNGKLKTSDSDMDSDARVLRTLPRTMMLSQTFRLRVWLEFVLISLQNGDRRSDDLLVYDRSYRQECPLNVGSRHKGPFYSVYEFKLSVVFLSTRQHRVILENLVDPIWIMDWYLVIIKIKMTIL